MKTNLLKLSLSAVVLCLFAMSTFSQGINFSDMESAAQQGSDTLVNIVKWILIAVIAAAFLFAIYYIATESQKSKTAIISLVVSLLIYAIAFALGVF